jgi:hypothetical protein
MSERIKHKYEEVFTEFSRYVLEHPEFLDSVLADALVVFVDKHDPEFSRCNIEMAHEHATVDDLPERPIVYVDTGRIRPVRSRLVRPRIVDEATAWVGATTVHA